MSCVGDSGYTPGEIAHNSAVRAAALIRETAAAAIAADNANQLVNNYKKQNAIADRMLKLSEAQQSHLQTTFWPRDDQFRDEFVQPEDIETIEVMARRYGGRLVSAVAKGFADQLAEAKCSMRRYCTSANRKMMQDILMARSVAIANAKTIGRNLAFAEYYARDDTNTKRRLQAIAMGRNLMDQAVTLFKDAGMHLTTAGNVLGQQFNSAFNSFRYNDEQRRIAGTFGDYMAQVNARQFNTPQTYASNINTGASAFSSSPAFSGQPGSYNLDGSFKTDGFNAPYMNKFGKFWDSNTSYSNYATQNQMWNQGDIGNHDLVRNGSHTYPVVGNPYGGTVTVQMSDFAMAYADHKTAGDTQL